MAKEKNDSKMKNDFAQRDEHERNRAMVMVVIGVLVLLAVTGGIGGIFGAIGGLIGTIFGGIGSLIGTIFGAAGGIIGAVFGFIGSIIGLVFGLIGGVLGIVFGLIGGILSIIFSVISLIIPIGLLLAGIKLLSDSKNRDEKAKRRLETVPWREESDDSFVGDEKAKNEYL